MILVVCIKEGFIVTGNIINNVKPIGNNAEFISITTMLVGVRLLYCKADESVGRYEVLNL